ncbi:hypothetical protein J2S55_008113 [Streptosporangium brasiliense]|uniref:Uncharacterized protein n=1 Tax=Streptosporangium brasiliense TaxID=47480 RepID=A0ABT9RHU6_9ACTN|nr:hypothetical protein [Streptosporangium brasiliense]
MRQTGGEPFQGDPSEAKGVPTTAARHSSGP